MPAGNPEAYNVVGPPGVAMQQMLASPQAIMGGPHAGNMANMLLQALGGQPQQPVSQAATPTAEIIRPQQQAMPQLSERDIAAFGQMDRPTIMATRQALQQRGWLTPEVDTHFSRRLQQLQMQQSRGK